MNKYFRELTVAAALLLLMLGLAIFAPHFFQIQPLISRLTSQMPALILAIGVALEPGTSQELQSKVLGNTRFVYAVAPHHPLAKAAEPITDSMMLAHRVVAVADSVQRGSGVTIGLLGGQDVFTVPGMLAKLDAQMRGLGVGFLPEYLARPYIEAGRLVEKKVTAQPRNMRVSYAWRTADGKALQWWLKQLDSPKTRSALLER